MGTARGVDVCKSSESALLDREVFGSLEVPKPQNSQDIKRNIEAPKFVRMKEKSLENLLTSADMSTSCDKAIATFEVEVEDGVVA